MEWFKLLYINFGIPYDFETDNVIAIINPDDYFNVSYRDEWFEDEFVKQMVLDVDKSEIKSSNCIDSPILGLIPPERLSGGVKALMLMYQDDYKDILVWATQCGDNCAKWILKIAEKKDLTIILSHYMSFGRFEDKMDAIINNLDKRVYTVEDYFNAALDCGVK